MYSPNDTIQIALIGAGGMGQGDARLAASLPGVKLVAACDCYDGRLTRMKEVYGQDTFTTRDYREIVARKDIDAKKIGSGRVGPITRKLSDEFRKRVAHNAPED